MSLCCRVLGHRFEPAYTREHKFFSYGMDKCTRCPVHRLAYIIKTRTYVPGLRKLFQSGGANAPSPR